METARETLPAAFTAKGQMPLGACCGSPWYDDGNIVFHCTRDNVYFKGYMGILMEVSDWFSGRIKGMSDDTVDIMDGCPIIPLEDSSQDVSNFLAAIYGGYHRCLYLGSGVGFVPLAGILRLATKYDAAELKAEALEKFQKFYPMTLSEFDQVQQSREDSDWTCDPMRIINLARETGAFSILPAAMVLLANDTSLGEAFSVKMHVGTTIRVPLYGMDSLDERGFAAMKEFSHISVVEILRLIRGIAKGCRQPPEVNTLHLGMAPVGSRCLTKNFSVCMETFRAIADTLADKLEAKNPVGYLDFVVSVRRIVVNKTRICQECRGAFENGLKQERVVWWDNLPHILGFSGWGDDRLR